MELPGHRIAGFPIWMAEGGDDFRLFGRRKKRGIAFVESFPGKKNFFLSPGSITTALEGGVSPSGRAAAERFSEFGEDIGDFFQSKAGEAGEWTAIQFRHRSGSG